MCVLWRKLAHNKCVFDTLLPYMQEGFVLAPHCKEDCGEPLFFFEGFLFYAHPSIGSFQHLLMSAYYRLKRVSPYDGRPTTRTKTLYVR